MCFQVLNIRGLNKTKYSELEETFFKNNEEINIVCLTETQNRHEKVKIHDKLSTHFAMREKGEKKGGGIQVIYLRTKQLRIEKIENKNKNLLELEGEIKGFDLKMIIVYFDTKNYGQGRT